MIACFDVHYGTDAARAAAIVFHHWDDTGGEQFSTQICDVGDYRPGNFYERELKPLRALLPMIPDAVKIFVIDAYCHLGPDASPGLGAILHPYLPEGSVVIGVAKNRFHGSHHILLLRGNSQRPLYITAIGMDNQTAANHIQSMAGAYRIPTLLKAVDQLARTGEDSDAT